MSDQAIAVTGTEEAQAQLATPDHGEHSTLNNALPMNTANTNLLPNATHLTKNYPVHK